MPLEYSYLVASVLFYFVMILVQATTGALHHGAVPLLGARDSLNPDSPFLARTKRATANMLENLVLFAPLVVVAVETGNANGATHFGAGLFLGARILYAPFYWFAVPLRPLAWFAGIVGTLIVASQILPFTGAA
ncbi:MAG: MAPEG family protein [Pseudomonadota bacterium]